MKKLMVMASMLALTINFAQAFDSYSDYAMYDSLRSQYERDQFNRMMENNRRNSAMNAMYSMQQDSNTLRRPHIPTTDYSYKSTYSFSKPLEVFGR